MIATEICSPVLEKEMREAVCRMKKGVSRVPDGVASFFYELCRAEPRGAKKPFGHYPEAAIAFAEAGARWEDVTRPMAVLRDELFTRYVTSIPSIMEMHSREQTSNGIVDHAQHRAISCPRVDTLDSLIEACEVQMAETKLLRAAAVKMRRALTNRED